MQDWLHGGDEVSIAFKVNYTSEDTLLVMVTSHFSLIHVLERDSQFNTTPGSEMKQCLTKFINNIQYCT